MRARKTLSERREISPEVLSNNRKDIGAICRYYREQIGVSQLQIALKLGYANVNFISMIETGRSSIPLGRLEEFKNAYKLPNEIIPIFLKNLYPEAWYAFISSAVDCPSIFGDSFDAFKIERAIDRKFKELLRIANQD